MAVGQRKITPSEEEVVFYDEFGKTITAWANVEFGLVFLTCACVKKKDWPLLTKGFYSIENFRSKLQFSGNLITTKFHDHPHIDEWPKLEKRLITLSKKRNKLAHYRVGVFPQKTRKEGRRIGLQSVLPPKNAKSSQQMEGHILFLADLMQIRAEFSSIWKNLMSFGGILMGKQVPLSELLPQVKSLPTLRTLRNRMHVVFAHHD